ncbi:MULTISPECIES: extracellular solute-binding protein [Rhodomicrobium]|uniref:extracellular solute-binding protein n=1 Tax=Rhodomicrobium TaxID=1068 RepID=UPI001FDA5CFD|nr:MULTISPECIES: extracellular solute-binding protein [Rhodomicrobium]
MNTKAQAFFATIGLLCVFAAPAGAAEKRHGLSAFGDLAYPADFQHFNYVNPDAPKGGRLSTIGTSSVLTFNSFNPFIIRDDPAQGLEFLFDSLMVRAQDEPDSMYGLIAQSAEVADDKRSVTFYLRPEAKFRDGTPLTAEDVVFSYEKLRDPTKAHPSYAAPLRDVAKGEVIDPHTVRFSFTGDNLRDLPSIVAGLPILSKAHYDKVDFYKPSLEPPMASGPYEIGEYKPGTFISYKRRPDYWAANLPVMRGRFNFDEIRYEYFRDRTAGMEAFKAGAYDLREEFTSKTWATEYNFPHIKNGKVKLVTLPDGSPSGAQGWFINTRREKFADPRVRKALDYAFDFEWTNKNLFYGLYKRTNSYFVNSDIEAKGPPSEAELKLLEPFRDKLPAEVFGEPYNPPVSDGSGRDRKLLTTASKLLTEAGWTVNAQGVRVNAKGEPLSLELLMDEPSLEKIFGFWVEKLKSIGIQASIRNIDSAQYQSRLKDFDFDIDMSRYSLDVTPGPEVRLFWSSEAARTKGSRNLAGIADPVVDALTEKMLNATSRDELRTAGNALDRVLRAGHYWVPQWYKAAHNIAFWDRFSWPAIKPKYDRGIQDTWWYDAEKAAKLGQ